ncbi:Uncharacterised protein [Legionella bozemanae]|nr:Uncharacterised protein [Legionella bozemanae]
MLSDKTIYLDNRYIVIKTNLSIQVETIILAPTTPAVIIR